MPAGAALLGHFGTPGLRRSALPMRFLAVCGLASVDERSKRDASERRRIEATIGSLPGDGPHRRVLRDYRGYLEARAEGAVCLRSVRLALRPAADLLARAQRAGRALAIQDDLAAYLADAPGQRAAVSGFVGFVRARHGADLTLPASGAGRVRERRRAIEAELLGLLQSADTGKMHARRLLAAALAHFHRLPKSALGKVAPQAIRLLSDGQGVAIDIGGRPYWLPGEFHAAAARLAGCPARA